MTSIKMICPDCLGQFLQDCRTCENLGLIEIFGLENLGAASVDFPFLDFYSQSLK